MFDESQQLLQNYSRSVNLFWNKTFQSNTSLLYSLILFFAYAIIFLIGLLANIFVIVMIIKRRRIRTLTNRFLLNLAISDLLATLICLPPTAYHYYDKRWIFGEFLCRFIPFMQGTSVAVSIFTLMAVSIDRFIAIQKPIHSKILCTSGRISFTIITTWIAAFSLMIPLVFHHHIVDPFDITLTACAEEWHSDNHARLIYDLILLLLLFILPLTLMTYCYIRISFSLWFIDSNIQTPISSSISHPTRHSTLSEETPNEIRRNFCQVTRPYTLHYHRTNENNLNNNTAKPLRRNTVLQDFQRSQQTLLKTTRRYSEADSIRHVHQLPIHIQSKSMAIHQRHSISQYTSALLHSSMTSLHSQHRILNYINGNHRPMIDLEHASRFLRSRRRVVKLLITLVIVFFVTRLPTHILSIYIDAVTNNFLPENTLINRTKSNLNEDAVAVYSSYVNKNDRQMFLVLYVNPIFQLLSLSNSAINPLCYCFMSHAVKHLLTVFQQRIRRGHQKCSSLTLMR